MNEWKSKCATFRTTRIRVKNKGVKATDGGQAKAASLQKHANELETLLKSMQVGTPYLAFLDEDVARTGVKISTTKNIVELSLPRSCFFSH